MTASKEAMMQRVEPILTTLQEAEKMAKHEQKDKKVGETVCGKHARKIKELFHNALSEVIWVSIDELYEDDWQESELGIPHKVAKLNVLTRGMLEYDNSYLSESFAAKPEDYRPYFYSYIIQEDTSSYRVVYERLREMKDKWFLASFSMKGFDRYHEYQGEIESSASPVTYRRHNIYISDITLDQETLDEINLSYDVIAKPTPDGNIAKILTALLQDVKFTRSRIYAVGNGNLIDIVGEKGGRPFDLIYDVGYHSRQHPHDNRSSYGAAIRSFQHVVPDAVLLSHWDDDHIMGCVYGRSELFDCLWIAPEIAKKRAISARRLAAYLTVNGKLVIAKREDTARRLARIVTLNSTVSLYLGENKSKHTITKENCGGMVIEITTQLNGQAVESLFCGDVPYEAVNTVIWGVRSGGYDNLLVPHHGSAMEYSPLKVRKSAQAIVCGDGSSNRPHDNHRTALEANGTGYSVEVTGNKTAPPWTELDLQ